MNTNNTTPAMADLGLDKLQAIADRVDARGLFNASCDIREWIESARAALARRAAQPVAPEKLTRSMCGTKDYCQGWNDCVDEFQGSATPSPQVAEGAELPKQSCEIWRKEGDIVVGPKPQGEGWAAWTIPGYAPYQGSWPNFTELDAQAIASQADVAVERSVLLKLTDLGRRYFATLFPLSRDTIATPAPASAGQAAPSSLAAKLTALRDEAEAERQSETNPNRERIYMGMRDAFNVAAILAAQPAEGAGQAGQVACSHVWNDFGQLGGRNVSWCPRCDTLAWTGKEPTERAAAPADPLDTPLPCDVKIGPGTIRKGVRLGVLVLRAQGLHSMLMEHMPKPTPEQQAAFDELLNRGAQPQPEAKGSK